MSVDLNLIRTFLEVCQTRHFGQAADNLQVTGSAVSARIKTLEGQLGTTLFLRLRHGIELTPAAERLITQFRHMLTTWEQVRFLVSVESAPQPNLTVAATSGVWESTDSVWVRRLVSAHKDVRLRLSTHGSSTIFRGLQQGSIDLGLTLDQLSGPEIVSRKVGELQLELRCETPGRTVAQALESDYLHVDWSTSFSTQFLSVFQDYITGRITVANAGLAAKLLSDFPGSAYLSRGLVDRLRTTVELHSVDGAPSFRVPVYASHTGWTGKLQAIQAAIEVFSEADFG